MDLRKELIQAIKEHTEHWKAVCGYNVPYDYEGLYHKLDVLLKTYNNG